MNDESKWKLETTGIWRTLEFGKRFNLVSTAIWRSLAFGNHRNFETTGITFVQHSRPCARA